MSGTRGCGLVPSHIVHESLILVLRTAPCVPSDSALPALLHQLELNHCWIIRLKYKPPVWLVVWALSHWQTFLCCLKHFSKIPIWDCFYSKESDKPPTSQPIIVAAHAVLRNIKMQIPLWWRSQWWHFVVLQCFIRHHGCPSSFRCYLIVLCAAVQLFSIQYEIWKFKFSPVFRNNWSQKWLTFGGSDALCLRNVFGTLNVFA